MRGDVETDDERHQHQAQRDRQSEVALAGFQRDGGGHHPRVAVDVAADDHHRADFGHRPPQPGEHRDTQGKPAVGQQQRHRLRAADADQRKLRRIVAPGILDDLPGDGGDQRNDQHALGNDHRRRREQQAVAAERPAARQGEINEHADDHRRQAHQRVQSDDHGAAPAKIRHRQPGAERHAEQRADDERRQAHAQRERDDFQQAMIEAAQKGESLGKGGKHGGRG